MLRRSIHIAVLSLVGLGLAGCMGARGPMWTLAPAVESTTAEDGLYPIVTHAFNFVGRGALGLIQAGDGDPAN